MNLKGNYPLLDCQESNIDLLVIAVVCVPNANILILMYDCFLLVYKILSENAYCVTIFLLNLF